jgi:type II secretory ATPase GspE/PulE/Tfp pilus assembly ATPase PilB-like protein
MRLVPWLNRTVRTDAPEAPQIAVAEALAPAAPVHADVEAMRDLMMGVVARYAEVNDPEDSSDSSDGDLSEGSPIHRIVMTIIEQAIIDRASAIHIEPGLRSTRVRYRIDGVLHEVMPMPKYVQIPLTNRVKILSDIDMATHRGLPQEGRFAITYLETDYNLCVNSHPGRHGDYLTLHLHSLPRIQSGFAALGIAAQIQEQLEWLLTRPCGLVLIAGPAGSGTTTTQYAFLHWLNTTGVNIATVEERTTYTLPGLTQTVPNARQGETFLKAVRALLRQDVDVIGFGDIRDKKTAQAALDAAASSLVVATMHATDPLCALARLAAMGIDPGLLTGTVSGVIGQRLVRRICPDCIETYELAHNELRRFGIAAESPEAQVTLARGTGCNACEQTGYFDRVGLYELFQWDRTLTKLFDEGASLPKLREAAFWNDGRRDLKADGLGKILAQATTPHEVMRVL